eukprot:c8046_g1_i1.p1 GENE.c8046_g1_i1~~c8046_g1_i1.p1  ORF type:complete len:846 (+),score=213.76 c8046_g1_i1:42-2579(+)
MSGGVSVGLVESVFEDLTRKVRSHLLGKGGGSNKLITQKGLARQVVNFLQQEFDLTPNVIIEDFVCKDKVEEASKAKSQWAIATQRAAALFDLQSNLLNKSHEMLSRHISATKDYRVETGWAEWYFDEHFVQPLLKQAESLKSLLESVQKEHAHAQQQFQIRREQATRPIMEQLQESNKKYTDIFNKINQDHLTDLCHQVSLSEQQISASELGNRGLQQPLQSSNAVDTIEYLQELYREAITTRPLLHTLLDHVRQACATKGVEVQVEMGGLKAVERSMEKAVEEYSGNFSRLLDLVRGSLVCDSVHDASVIVNTLLSTTNTSITFQNSESEIKKVEICRIKNRLDRKFAAFAESGGYRDLLLNLRFNASHVCELQIQLKDFLNLKTGGGHKIYTIARSLHLLDPELSQVRVTALEAPNDNSIVRNDIKQALLRVENGTCQGLHLNHIHLTISECKAFKKALESPACKVHEIALPNCGLNDELRQALSEGDGVGSSSVVKANAHLADFQIVNVASNKEINGECVALFVSRELERLCVLDCGIGEVGHWRAIAEALEFHKPHRVQELNFANNSIGPAGAVHLGGPMQHMPLMTSLNLDENKLGVEGIGHVTAALSNMPRVTFLNLAKNDIKAQGAKSIASALGNMTQMTHLDLGGNDLGSEGVVGVSASLARMPQVTYLDLAGAGMGADGAISLAPSLMNMPHLTSLNLRYNLIEGGGCQSIAPALASMTELTFLDMTSNRAGTEGSVCVTTAVSRLPLLNTLMFSDNVIGLEGAGGVAAGLQFMSHVTSLDLSNNKLTGKGSNILCSSLKKMPQLTSLNLWGNSLESEAKSSLRTSLKHIQHLLV